MVSSKSDITVSRGLKVRLPYTKIGVCHGRAGIHQSVGKVRHMYDYKIPRGPSASRGAGSRSTTRQQKSQVVC
jgi:hypothetical protein